MKSALHAKLVRVGQAVTHVEKDGKNSFHKYLYASASGVLAAIRKPLFAEGVTLTPSVESIDDREYTTAGGKTSVVTTVTVKFTFVDAESGEREEHVWAGRGDDNADKGLSKAYTSAVKTFILETFLLPTGDDPEADARTDERAATRQPAPAPHRGDPSPPWRAPAPQDPPNVAAAIAEAKAAVAAGVEIGPLLATVGAEKKQTFPATVRGMSGQQVAQFRSNLADAAA